MKPLTASRLQSPVSGPRFVPRRVLIIGPSNIGDAVLISPVVARVHRAYPSAHVTLLVGERARAVFANDPRIRQVWVMEEWSGLAGRLRLLWAVWRLRPKVLIDLRQTILPLLWRPWRILRYVRPVPKTATHMRQRHLWRLHTQEPRLKTGNSEAPLQSQAIWVSREDVASVERLLVRWGVDPAKPLAVVCPGARSHIKRWPADRFAQVADRLIARHQMEVVFSGEPDEIPIIQDILRSTQHRAYNAAGSMTLPQLAALMQRARLVLTNDSASLHLACAVGAPVLALFGPTDPRKYGPTGPRDRVLQRRLFCVPCEQALCRFTHECMRFLTSDEVYEAARQLLDGASASRSAAI